MADVHTGSGDRSGACPGAAGTYLAFPKAGPTFAKKRWSMFLRTLLAALMLFPLAGCTNKNNSLEEAVEDASHETGQALERVGDSIQDATN